MTDWEMKQIKNLGRIVTGKTPPTNNLEYFGGDELFVSPKDLDWNSHYITETETRITSKALEKFKNQVIPRNTVMFTSLSFAFGKMGIASKPCLTNQQINSVIVNKENSPKFVYYLLRAYEPIIFSYNSGIDTPIVPKSVFEKIEVKIPSKKFQEKIAATLSAYDELIENNQRRIALLEKMAEEIYREWFVRMRFPGHEKVKKVKGVPEGWEIQKIGQLFNTSSGGTPPRENISNFNGEICWAKTGELKSTFVLDTEEKISQSGIDSSSAKIYPRYTIVIAMYCAMPDISILAVDSATNQACCAFFPKNDYFHYSYSYLLIKFAQKHMINFAHGAAQQNLSQELIKGFPLLTPTKDLIIEYSKVAEPIFIQVEQLMKTNTYLRKIRDQLLPRLISGKLSVEQLDIRFPPGMEESVHDI